MERLADDKSVAAMASEEQEVQSQPATAVPIWHRLTEAREARGWSVHEVARHIKLTVRQVEAMEQGDIAQLPGLAFARGFVRNYTRLLELDPTPFLSALEPVKVQPESLEPSMEDLGRMPEGNRMGRFTALPAALIAAILVMLVVAGWYFGWFEPREEATLAEVVAQSEARVEQSAAAAESAVAALPTTAAPVAQSTPSAASDTAAPQVAGMQRARFSFDADSWVEVRDGSDKVIFSRLNGKGTNVEVQGQAPLSVVVGNAASVRAVVDGKPFDLNPYIKTGGIARAKLQ